MAAESDLVLGLGLGGRRRQRSKSKRRSDALVFLSNIPLDGPGSGVVQSENVRSITHRQRNNEGFLVSVIHQNIECSATRPRPRPNNNNADNISDEDHLGLGLGLADHSVLKCGAPRRRREEFGERIHRNSLLLQNDRSLSIQICQEKSFLIGSSHSQRERLLSSSASGNIRMIFISSHKSPFAIFSFLCYKRLKPCRYETESSVHLRSRKHSGNQPVGACDDLTTPLSSIELADGKTVSYCHFLVPTREHLNIQHLQLKQIGQDIPVPALPNSPAVKKLPSHPLKHIGLPASPTKVVDAENIFHENISTGGQLYDPNLLDDPELSAGKHKKVLTFPSYMVSIIEHTKPNELKRDLNEQFAERFPRINLTLSKLKSIKKDMWKICLDCDIEPATLAQAYAYYEKLVLIEKIHKQNRKLCAGASLLLSVKLNDVKRSDLDNIVKEIEEKFRVSRKELFSYEFLVLVALEFSLHLPEFEVLPHYKRIIQLA